MNFPILNDAKSVADRASSTTGYLTNDVDLLLSLQILKKNRSGLSINKKLVNDGSEIRDFLTWATGEKKTPLPPLARRILCLKRAIVKNSIASVNPGTQQRTGEKQQLEEIDMLLKADGAVNLDDEEKCMTEGSKWIPKSRGGVTNMGTSTDPSLHGCHTTVNCAPDSALSVLIGEIKAKLDTLETKGCDLTALNAKVDSIDAKITALGAAGGTGATGAGVIGVVAPGTGVTGQTAPPADENGLITDSLAIKADADILATEAASARGSVSSTGSDYSVISGKIANMTTKVRGVPHIPHDVHALLMRNLTGALPPLDEPTKGTLNGLIALINTKTARPPEGAAGAGGTGGTGRTGRTGAGNAGAPAASAPPANTHEADRAAMLGMLLEIKFETAKIQPIQELVTRIQTQMAAGDKIDESIETLQAILQSYNLEELAEKVNELKTAVDPLITELQGVREVLNEALAGIRDIPEQLAAVAAQVISNLQPKLNSIENRLTAKLDEIKEDTTAIRGEVGTMKTEIAERNAAAASKLDVIEEKLDMLVTNHARSDDEIQTRLDGMAEDIDEQLKILAETAEQIERIEELIQATHGDDSPLARALQDHANHTAAQLNALEAANHGGRNDEQIELIKSLVEASQELQRRLGDCDGKDTRIAELERLLTEKQAALDGLQTNATAAHGSVEQLTTAAAQRNQEVSRLTAQIEGLTRERDAAVTTSGSKDAAIAEARRTIVNLGTEMEAIRGSLGALEGQIARNGRNARITALEQEKAALETRLRECEEGKTALQTSIAALEAGGSRNTEALRAQLAEQTRACEAAATEAGQRYAAQLQEATSARDEAIRAAVKNAGATKNTDIQSLQGQLRDCNEQKAVLQTELDAARTRITELEAQLATVGQERNDARAAGVAAQEAAARNAAAARAAAEQAAANAAAALEETRLASEQEAARAAALEETRLASEQEAARAAAAPAAARLPPGSSVNDQIRAFKSDIKLPYLEEKIKRLQKTHRINDAVKTALDMRAVIEAYGTSLLGAKLDAFFSTQGGAMIKTLIPPEFSSPTRTLQNIFTLFNKLDTSKAVGLMGPPWRGGSRKRRNRNKSARHTRRRR